MYLQPIAQNLKQWLFLSVCLRVGPFLKFLMSVKSIISHPVSPTGNLLLLYPFPTYHIPDVAKSSGWQQWPANWLVACKPLPPCYQGDHCESIFHTSPTPAFALRRTDNTLDPGLWPSLLPNFCWHLLLPPVGLNNSYLFLRLGEEQRMTLLNDPSAPNLPHFTSLSQDFM